MSEQELTSQTALLLRIVPAAVGLTLFWGLESLQAGTGTLRRRLQHAGRNLSLAVLNGVMMLFTVAGLTAFAVDLVQQHSFGFLNWLPGNAVSRGVLAVVLLDVWTWAWHRANHRIPALWRFHRVHHGDPEMDATTSARFHPGELVLSAVCRLPLIAALGVTSKDLLIFETLLLLVSQFQHSHCLPVADSWRTGWLIVTPAMHRVHHSRLPAETNSNYASILAIWDRIFGTYRDPREVRPGRTGLDELDSVTSQTVLGMLKTPFDRQIR